MNALSALDVLRMKIDKAPLENAVALFADYELEARQDGRNIIASLAAAELAAKDAELAALRQERDALRAVVEAARYVVSETHGVNDDSVPDTFKAHLTVGDIRYLAAALERVNGKGEK